MKYFDILPKINYEFSTGSQTLPDLFSRVSFTDSFLNNPGFVYTERQENILRPENLSLNLYESFDLYWLLLIANDVYDVNRDWPVLQESFGLELSRLNKKKIYYLYENADILKYDILYLNEVSYGIVESWNPSYKELVISTNFNLPTDVSSVEFSIRRIVNNNPINIKNYCLNEIFTSFGVSDYVNSVYQIKQGSKILNPFLKVENDEINTTGELLIDVCDTSDKTAFQNSLIYKVVNNQTVNNITKYTKQNELVRQYAEKMNLNIIQPQVASALENKIKIMLNDRFETANTITRIG